MPADSFPQEFVKQPNVSGQFYEADPRRLSSMIEGFLDKADPQIKSENIHMLMVPHAGHVYSGPVAAYGFKAVKGGNYKTVILLGPTHYYRFEGVSVWPKGKFITPLGDVEVDDQFAGKVLRSVDKASAIPQIFEQDHVLEVEIPFLQTVLSDFKIVPMIMSRNVSQKTVQKLTDALHEAAGGRDDVLLLVSSDLSHFHDAETAEAIDRRGLEAVEAMDIEGLWNGHQAGEMEIDGYKEVITGLLYAQKRGANKTEVLKYGHSGDVSGDMQRVVGYAAVAAYENSNGNPSSARAAGKAESESTLSREQKERLLDIAKTTIHKFIKEGDVHKFKEDDPRLLREEGTFVTINKNGRLRGCMGNILGKGPLAYLVRDMAITSATEDPRFKPLTEEELDDIEVEVSVLSQPRRIKNIDEIELGKHGVILGKGPYHRGVFLPKVATDTGWDKATFLAQLCSQKAGLPPDCYKDPQVEIEIFDAEEFGEKDLR